MAKAAISYRTTGISSTQSETTFARSWMGIRNVLVFCIGVLLMISIQILGTRYGGTPRRTLWMGIAAYLTIVSFTFSILLMVKGEIKAEKKSYHLASTMQSGHSAMPAIPTIVEQSDRRRTR
jgi:hypothetical protein